MKHFLKLIPFTFFLCTFLHAQSWTPYNIGAVDDVIEVSFPTVDTGYVVTGYPELRKTVNGAVSWSVVTTPVPIWHAYFITGLKGFSYADSVVYMTLDGGATWTETLHDNEIECIHMQFINQTTGFLTASNTFTSFDSTRLYKTIDGGASWSQAGVVLNYIYENALFFTNATDGVLGHNNGISFTSNSGISFNNVWNDPFYSPTAMFFPTADTGYAIDISGLSIRSTNGGVSWSAMTTPGGVGLYDLYFVNGQKGFVCGGNGASSGWVQQTSDGGNSWTPSYTSPLTFASMDFPNDNTGYAGGQSGTVIKYSNTITAIESHENVTRISVFPNPSYDGRITVDFGKQSCHQIEIHTTTGQVIPADVTPLTNNQIAIEGLCPGIYYLRMLFDNGKSEVKQVVVL